VQTHEFLGRRADLYVQASRKDALCALHFGGVSLDAPG
jgi:hypothetical protein